MLHICYVGFGSLDVVCDELLVCSSFLMRECMFIVSKALLISSDTVIVRAGGAIWDMGLYGVPLSMSLLGFGMGTMLANLHI